MTFTDYESRTVWNGSALDKNLLANVFNEWWRERALAQRQNTEQKSTATLPVADKNAADEKEKNLRFFDFLDKEQPTDDTGLIDGVGGLLPEARGEDYEEQVFEILQMVNALESKSTHPVATAIHEYAGKLVIALRQTMSKKLQVMD